MLELTTSPVIAWGVIVLRSLRHLPPQIGRIRYWSHNVPRHIPRMYLLDTLFEQVPLHAVIAEDTGASSDLAASALEQM